jgi:peptidyl-dipeptidase A
MWTSWHSNVGARCGKDYTRLVEIANQGAKELGYRDVGRDVALQIRYAAR